ncbi:MAG: hypothetical protein EBT07_17685 [Actinobacteria bacterium]|nr:hypothetical protein [Actinomycetota bacterium]
MIFGFRSDLKYHRAFRDGSLAGKQYALNSVEAMLHSEIKKLKASKQDEKKVEMLISEIHWLVKKVQEMYDN